MEFNQLTGLGLSHPMGHRSSGAGQYSTAAIRQSGLEECCTADNADVTPVKARASEISVEGAV